MKHVYWSIISEHDMVQLMFASDPFHVCRSFPCLSILAEAGEYPAIDFDDIHNLYQLVQLWPFTSYKYL